MKHSDHDASVGFSAAGLDGIEFDYIAHYSVSGSFSKATRDEPASYPEAEICCVERDDPSNPGTVEESDYPALGITIQFLRDLEESAAEEYGRREADRREADEEDAADAARERAWERRLDGE